MSKAKKVKFVMMGPWLVDRGKGKKEPSGDGRLIEAWMSGKSIDDLDLFDDIPRFEKLLRTELAAHRRYRELLHTEINLLRNELLDQANAVIPDLSNPGATLVEAYNNGLNMGRHWKPVEIAQKLSDIMDHFALEKILDEG